ncbi:glycosyltransferase family 9 protein [Bordetella genomosp. 13]|uniref:Heptosyltransferase n=1 Tax=Bordetella genomosp. 13 TaxID=463040 RepID=A0A1W6ZEQ2_9BORD|nr:glycosyltransferase family 9 protein [Bordetella genomosp. 13]ARP95354.1 hypothetical protein CAL15_13745 [Bordetella genomosp. 13]
MVPSSTSARGNFLMRQALAAGGAIRKAARHAERSTKRRLLELLAFRDSSRTEKHIDELRGISRIIVIRPNYRIGNAVISTSILEPLQLKYPGATIDFLATDKTTSVFRNLPVGTVAALSRAAISRPWRMVSLLRQLRRGRYDLAVQLEDGSLTGLLISRAIGARYVIGKPKGDACWYDVNVRQDVTHAYDTASVFSRALGVVGCPARPRLVLCPRERSQAAAQLESLGLATARDGRTEPFVAVFVGGHDDKVCPASFWAELFRGLDGGQRRFVVFVGPEEQALAPRIEQALAALPHGRLCRTRPLREFAAMLERASVLVTPDSGPMHIAAALRVPVVAMARSHRSTCFIPDYDDTRTVWNLDVAEALRAIGEVTAGAAAPA